MAPALASVMVLAAEASVASAPESAAAMTAAALALGGVDGPEEAADALGCALGTAGGEPMMPASMPVVYA